MSVSSVLRLAAPLEAVERPLENAEVLAEATFVKTELREDRFFLRSFFAFCEDFFGDQAASAYRLG
jgi:hypothetical protein